jgi:hypothetical protein
VIIDGDGGGGGGVTMSRTQATLITKTKAAKRITRKKTKRRREAKTGKMVENTTRLTNEDWVDEEEDSVVMRKTNRVKNICL